MGSCQKHPEGGLLKSRTSPFENTYPPKNGNIGLDIDENPP